MYKRQQYAAGQQPQQQQQQQRAAPEAKGYGQHSAAVAAAAKRQVKQKGPFELSLDSSTLLSKRKNKGGPSGLRQEMEVQ